MVMKESVKKELVIRYGTELRAINKYLDIMDDTDDSHIYECLSEECRLRLVFLDWLHRLLISAYVDLSDYNGQYINLMRRVYEVRHNA